MATGAASPPQVFAHRMEGNFHLAAQDKPGQDLERSRLQIRTEHGLGRECASWIADQHPPDGHRRLAGMIPDRRLRDDLDDATLLPVPAWHAQHCPERRWLVPNFFRVGSRLPIMRGRPFWRGLRGGAGVKSRASRRKRVTRVARWRVAASNSMAAYSRSPTLASKREGHQRWSKQIIWRAQAVTGLCCRPHPWA